MNNCKVVIVNGRPGCGKTTFENFCRQKMGAYCRTRSTVDKVKDIAKEAGWKGGKELKDRKFLSDLKDLFTEYNDMPFNDILNFLYGWEMDLEYYGVDFMPHLLLVDDREPEHIDRLKKRVDGITLLIRRPGDEDIETSNHADANVLNYEYDYIIINDGTKEDL